MKFKTSKGILIAFGELFLKSENVKKIFKRKLNQNIVFYLRRKKLDFRFYQLRERIFIESTQINKVKRVVRHIFGIAWFAESLFFKDINLKKLSEYISENYRNWIKKDESFALRLVKGDFKVKREKIIEEIAKNINRKVNLSNPKREIFIEKRKENLFLYFKKINGMGGLPSGVSGKVLTLVSGGIDSPVAAFLLAKRGTEQVWLHFHSFPLVSRRSIEKTKELSRIFLNYQPRLKIYLVPFSPAQFRIKTKIPAKYRILIYRRIMLKIAQDVARKEKCLALVTGESLGQVSSQTLPNIKIIEEGIKMPVFRPLIGMDKEEIITLARKIKTFSISIKPQEDCCILFVPKHSSAKGKIEKIRELEAKLEFKEIIREAEKKAEVLYLK